MSWRLSGLVAVGLVLGVFAARVTQDPDSGTATWDAERAAGFAGYLLLWASTVLGIGVHFRYRPGGGPLTLVLESHRVCSALALSFVVGHVVALLVDPVVHFSLLDALVPFTSTYRPIQVGMGTSALWLLIATLASTAAAGYMRHTTWRTIHYLAFPTYGLALIHGLTSGTDSTAVPALTIYASTAAVVAALSFARILGRGFVAAGEAPSPTA
ncbi:MAG: ferric reductase [Tepidiformaceae bacterium]